jgi:hypothetical protein
MPCKKYEFFTTNQAEIDRLRGTPGEPIPIQEHRVRLVMEWRDRVLQNTQTYNEVENFVISVLITAEQDGSKWSEASTPDGP